MERTAQYLIAIFALEETNRAPVSSGELSRVLGRSQQATTEKLQRLAEEGFVTYEPYTGVRLTETGREQASTLYETHVILCRFYRDVLLLDDYVDEALTLAGHVSPAVARRLRTTILPPENDSTAPELLHPNTEADESARWDGSTQTR